MNIGKILFAADNHYGTHGGKVLYESLKDDFNIDFYEDDWKCFSHEYLTHKYDLIILNMISGTCDNHSPSLQDTKNILSYLQLSMPIFLLHGSSAAFWQWNWWREIVGFRWVREGDPDGVLPSSHPVCSYGLKKTKVRHPIQNELREINILKDELYTELEQTCQTITLLEAVTEKGTFPMCYETTTPWFGKIAGYIPGHDPDVIKMTDNIHNCKAIIKWLLN